MRRERNERAKRRSIDRRIRRDRHRGRWWLQHPRRNPQVDPVVAPDSHRSIGSARTRDDLERATGQRVERVVNDDRQTMGIGRDCC